MAAFSARVNSYDPALTRPNVSKTTGFQNELKIWGPNVTSTTAVSVPAIVGYTTAWANGTPPTWDAATSTWRGLFTCAPQTNIIDNREMTIVVGDNGEWKFRVMVANRPPRSNAYFVVRGDHLTTFLVHVHVNGWWRWFLPPVYYRDAPLNRLEVWGFLVSPDNPPEQLQISGFNLSFDPDQLPWWNDGVWEAAFRCQLEGATGLAAALGWMHVALHDLGNLWPFPVRLMNTTGPGPIP